MKHFKFSHTACYFLDLTVVRMKGNYSLQAYLRSFLPSDSCVCLCRVAIDFFFFLMYQISVFLVKNCNLEKKHWATLQWQVQSQINWRVTLSKTSLDGVTFSWVSAKRGNKWDWKNDCFEGREMWIQLICYRIAFYSFWHGKPN